MRKTCGFVLTRPQAMPIRTSTGHRITDALQTRLIDGAAAVVKKCRNATHKY